MFDDVVTRSVRVLRICVGALRDVTVLAEFSSADEPTDLQSVSRAVSGCRRIPMKPPDLR
jgi:hypothetical protein